MKNNLLYCATDKEIFDVLMSSKQKINTQTILELAKDRKIFYSSKDSREALVHRLSLLTHDFNDLNLILNQREHAGRAEKTTSLTLKTELTMEEIKEVAREYIEQSPADEKVIAHQDGTYQYKMSVEYAEIDYSKTRLVQRTKKEAGIEFHIDGDRTVIRMPSNAKAKEIVNNIKNRLDAKKKTDISTGLIELSEFSTAAERTRFFTFLISTLKGFKLNNVTSVKVEPFKRESNEDELDLEDDQNREEAKQDALALVRNVALKGESLLASEEYQSLLKKGFFITSIIWRSKENTAPLSIVEFEAAFEDPEIGKGFKYSVRGALHVTNGDYTKTLRPIESISKKKYLSLIEEAAENAILLIKRESSNQENITKPMEEK